MERDIFRRERGGKLGPPCRFRVGVNINGRASFLSQKAKRREYILNAAGIIAQIERQKVVAGPVPRRDGGARLETLYREQSLACAG